MTELRDIPFSCSCGKLSGVLHNAAPAGGTHAACFCRDCRAAEIFGNRPDPAPEPVDLFRTAPENIEITKGGENLAAFSFGEKNLLRWQASCCGAPIANTLRNPKIAFASISTACLADVSVLGPVVSEAFIPVPGAKPKHRGIGKFVIGTLSQVLAARLSGRWKDNPFFDADGAPIRTVYVVPKAERAALLP